MGEESGKSLVEGRLQNSEQIHDFTLFSCLQVRVKKIYIISEIHCNMSWAPYLNYLAVLDCPFQIPLCLEQKSIRQNHLPAGSSCSHCSLHAPLSNRLALCFDTGSRHLHLKIEIPILAGPPGRRSHAL